MRAPPVWTSEETDTLRRMWIEGASYSKIGLAVGKTKNAVAGKADRLNLPKRGHEHNRRKASENARKRWGEPREKAKKFNLKRTTPRERQPPVHLRAIPAPDCRPVPFIKRTGCAYPTTDDKPHLFCNEPMDRGDYCEFHLQVMYPRGKVV